MKLYPDKLSRHLKDQLMPIYLVTGDEPLIVQEACDSIRQAARKAGCEEREVHHAETGFDWQQVLMSANSLSLFADKKIIDLRIPNGKPGDAGAKALIEYATNASPDNILLITCPKLDGNQKRSKWFKALDKQGVVVEVWPIDANRITGWIAQRLKSAGLHADQDALRMLAERAEGNLLAGVQEIEKLKLLSDEKNITPQLINQVVADSARYDVFTLVDRALMGDARSALKTLSGLKGEGTEATVILWALTREIRTLALAAEAVGKGQAEDWALKNAGVWDKRKPMFKQALHRLPLNMLYTLLRKATAIDQSVKGINKGNTWDLLEQLVLKLSGTH